MEDELKKKLGDMLGETFDKLQDRPNQFVVTYYKVSDDSLIGYHASTFCQVTKDIMKGKRYSAEDPYPQLTTISENLKYTLDKEHEGMFSSINKSIQENDFGGLKSSEVWMDAIYLAEGMPKQSFRYTII